MPEKEKAKGKSKDECVRVIVRCRPFNSKEKKEGNGRAVFVNPKDHTVEVKDCDNPKLAPKRWTFDATFDENCTQRDIYDSAAAAIVDDVLEGFNGTIFAYGQTGAGKSFTMEGMKEWRAANKPELRGIIPNAMEHIFERVAADSGDETQFLIRCSYLEIYNEEVRDLLAKGKSKGKLEIKSHPDKGVYVDGLTEIKCASVGELEEAQERGNKQRSVGATLMNAGSSRSHSVFTVIIERSDMGPDGEPHIRAGKLNLVDLAGSERSTKTGATGDRLKEGIMINKSLSALGNVISALTDAKSTHVPYRDSKLTRLLQDSLGGNTKTMMCANCGPADYNMEETISTLRYADRAKQIKNKPKINEDPKDAALRQMQEEIKQLRELLAAGGDIPPEMLAKLGGGGRKTKKKEQKIKRGPRVETKVITQVEEVIVEEEEIVKDGLTEEELAEKKKQMEEEREKARLAAEREWKKHNREMKMSELESQKMEGDLQQTMSQAQEAERAKKMLKERLAEMQSQMIVGQQLQAKAAKQEAELRRAQIAKAEKERLAAQKERELAAQEEQMNLLNTSFNSLEEEVRAKTEKLEKLRDRYLQAKEEIKDMQEEYRRERDDLWMAVRDLGRQIKLKDLIIKNFVSQEQGAEMHAKAVWDDDIGDWIVGAETTIDLYSYKRPSTDPAIRNLKEEPSFPQSLALLPHSDFRAGQSVYTKYGRNRVGETDRGGERYETKNGHKVLVWTTDLVRTGNITQLEMDPHQRTTQDYDEHHKQRQAQSALNMAMDPDEESDSDGYRR